MNTHLAERGTIYTLGYTQRDAVARLEQLMRDPCTFLLDVRLQPRSRWNHEWDRTQLVVRYGERYIWEGRLGNTRYRESNRAIALAAGYQEAVNEAAALVCAGRSLVLLCACADERSCHRMLVARLIQDALPVLVSPWEARR